MISLLKQVINTKNKWGFKSLILGSIFESVFLIRNPKFKYLFFIEPDDLDIGKEESKLSDPYGPAPYYILTICLDLTKHIVNDIQNSIFIDIGSGPCRVLYCASKIGYKRLIGIEQSKKLSGLCDTNLKRHLSPHSVAKIVNQNVKDIKFYELISDFEQDYKTDSLVFFLYAPFKNEMLEILLDKFDELISYNCYIIYFGPQTEHTLTRKDFSVIYTENVNADTPIKIYFRKKVFNNMPMIH